MSKTKHTAIPVSAASSAQAKRPRIRNAEATLEKIFQAAERLFSQHGFGSVTTKQLAADAGVAMGALYHHFPSKEALYAETTKRVFAKKATPPTELLDSTLKPEEKMASLVTWFVKLMMQDDSFGPLLKREMLDPRPSTPQFVDSGQFKEALSEFQNLILQIEPNANLDEAIASILALIYGFANLRGIYSLFPGINQSLTTPEEIATHAMRLMLSSLSPTS